MPQEAVEALTRAGLRNPVRVAVAVSEKGGSKGSAGAGEQKTPSSLSVYYMLCESDCKMAQLVGAEMHVPPRLTIGGTARGQIWLKGPCPWAPCALLAPLVRIFSTCLRPPPVLCFLRSPLSDAPPPNFLEHRPWRIAMPSSSSRPFKGWGKEQPSVLCMPPPCSGLNSASAAALPSDVPLNWSKVHFLKSRKDEKIIVYFLTCAVVDYYLVTPHPFCPSPCPFPPHPSRSCPPPPPSCGVLPHTYVLPWQLRRRPRLHLPTAPRSDPLPPKRSSWETWKRRRASPSMGSMAA